MKAWHCWSTHKALISLLWGSQTHWVMTDTTYTGDWPSQSAALVSSPMTWNNRSVTKHCNIYFYFFWLCCLFFCKKRPSITSCHITGVLKRRAKRLHACARTFHLRLCLSNFILPKLISSKSIEQHRCQRKFHACFFGTVVKFYPATDTIYNI